MDSSFVVLMFEDTEAIVRGTTSNGDEAETCQQTSTCGFIVTYPR